MKNIDYEYFKNPVTDPDYSVSAFWFWNDLITDEKTTEQLNMMNRIHADQPVIHSRFGLENKYLSEDWFDRIQSAIDTCRKNGQKIWLYDENNWPSGTCAWTITKELKYREHFLQFETKELKAGEVYTPDTKEYIHFSIKTGKGREMLSLAPGQSYQAEEQGTLTAVCVSYDPYEKQGRISLDYLNEEAVAVFLESTHEKYKSHFAEEFGQIISGIFMDEPRFCNAMPWTETFAEKFREKKGYDLLPLLPCLIDQKEPKAELVRFDYYDVVSELYSKSVFRQISRWCEENGIQLIGHLLGEETLAAQSYFGADMTRAYKYFQVPGIDHLGNGIGSLDAKFAVSAAHSWGKDRIACEAFGASGWDITYEEMLKISNWLFQQGINLIMMHGFYYSIRDRRSQDFPPSYFYQWKYWDKMPEYVKMANRMMNLLSGGRHECNILVYSPMETFWKHFEPDLQVKTGFGEAGPWITDKQAKFIDNQFQFLCNGLTDRNLDYDILNSDAAENFGIKDGKLYNRMSGETFEILIVPTVELLTEEMAEFLNGFTAAGGTVIAYRTQNVKILCRDGSHMRQEPAVHLNEELLLHTEKLSEVFRWCEDKVHLPFEILCGENRMAHTLSSYPPRLIDPYLHDGEQVYGIGVTRYLKGGERIYNFTNYNEKEEDLCVWVESADIPRLLNPETGEIAVCGEAVREKEGYCLSFTVPANRTLFLVGTLL